MDGFTRHKEQSKVEIRKAAWELFSQFGVDRIIPQPAHAFADAHVALLRNFVHEVVFRQHCR